MTNTYNHAEIEFDILSKSATDPENRPVIEEFREEILALCEKFGNSGQSGGSAPYVAKVLASAIEKLCLFEPISPITGLDEEWMLVSSDITGGKEIYQNIRCGAIFKEGKDSKPYYLDALVLIDTKGYGWSGSATMPDGSTIRCRQYIKEFPFTPKTFKINIIDKEVAPDDWEFVLEDTTQLDEVYEYYARN